MRRRVPCPGGFSFSTLIPARALRRSTLQPPQNDAPTEVGSEALSASLVVYQYGRNSGDGESLEGLLDDMGQRFARKSGGPKSTPSGGNPTQ